jgi:hypothetical protein
VEEVVGEGWGMDRVGDVVDHMSGCSKKLKGWERRKHMRFKEEIVHCSREFDVLRYHTEADDNKRFSELKEKLANILIQRSCCGNRELKCTGSRGT